MKKLNNKGFAISTVLYGLLMLVIVVLALILQTLKIGNENNKTASEDIQKELDECRQERIDYYKCSEDCDEKKDAYQNCVGNP